MGLEYSMADALGLDRRRADDEAAAAREGRPMVNKDRAQVKFLFAAPKWKFGGFLAYLPRHSVNKFELCPAWCGR